MLFKYAFFWDSISFFLAIFSGTHPVEQQGATQLPVPPDEVYVNVVKESTVTGTTCVAW